MDHTENEGQIAFNIHSQIAENESKRRVLMHENISLLKEMKETKLYRVILGDDTAKWHAYLGQIETMYSRNEVHALLRIRGKYIDYLGLTFNDIAQIPKSRLLALIPVITESNMKELLSQAEVLTNQDFKDVVRGIKGLPTTDDLHEHKFDIYEVCSICGLKHKHETPESIPVQSS